MSDLYRTIPNRKLTVSERLLAACIEGNMPGAADFALYLFIVRLCGKEDGVCWASNNYLIDNLHLSRRQVIYSIQNLAKLGVIRIEQENKVRKIYLVYSDERGSANHCTGGVQIIAPKGLDTGVSKPSQTEGGTTPPQKIYQKVPEKGLVELNGKSSSTKEKKPVPEPSKEAMAVARELREAIRSVRRWIPAASSNKRWAIELTKLAKRKSPTDLSKGWATIRSTIKLIHYADHPDYKQPDFDDAFTFCRFFNWITQSLQEVRHSEM